MGCWCQTRRSTLSLRGLLPIPNPAFGNPNPETSHPKPESRTSNPESRNRCLQERSHLGSNLARQRARPRAMYGDVGLIGCASAARFSGDLYVGYGLVLDVLKDEMKDLLDFQLERESSLLTNYWSESTDFRGICTWATGWCWTC